MTQQRGSLFQQLTRLFRSGPIVKRKVRNIDTRVAGPDMSGHSSSVLLLSKTQVGNFNSIISGGQGYVTQERMSRLQDFNEMDAYAEINAALDIYADESVAQDAAGRSIHIHSDNPAIKKSLEELFYNTINAEFNLRPWTRNLCKYGDFYLYIDVSPEYGVINVVPIPVNELSREEGFDPHDPLAVRFRWQSLGNRTVENWEVAHFRLLGNDQHLPYGTSMIDGARRIWRQLVLIEDAMLVYRVTRSPERRVFYVDVGGVAPDEIANYMEAAKTNIKSAQVIDRNTGRVDLRYNPLPIASTSLIAMYGLKGQTTLTIAELSKKWEAYSRGEGPQPVVCSIQDNTNRIVPGYVAWCGKNYHADELVRVWLDDGTYVDTAAEHPYVMRDGTSKRADELEVGQSLMPYYTRMSKSNEYISGKKRLLDGYEMTYDPGLNAWEYTHRLFAEAEHGILPRGHVVHHIDFDKLNNHPNNLQPLSFKEHKKLHADEASIRNKSDAGRAASRSRMLRTWAEKKITREMIISMRKNPEENKKRKQALTLKYEPATIVRFLDQAFEMCLPQFEKGVLHETQFFDALNSIDDFRNYLLTENPNFNNGYNDGFRSRCAIRSMWKRCGFNGCLTQFVNERLSKRFNRKLLENFHGKTKVCVQRELGLSRKALERVAKLHFGTFSNYSNTHLDSHLKKVTNHKVTKIERIDGDDVFCMTVVGLNGEEDRHNFAVLGKSVDPTKQSKSGIFVKNSVEEDYWIPVRGSDTNTRIDTLQAGQNTGNVEDVQYIQKKLIAALKVPAAYLGYNDAIPGASGLAQVDVRFSRTVNMIQRTIVSELNKVAMIHLFAAGFRGDDLIDFEIRLSNPSTIAQQQKLELLRTRFEIAASSPPAGPGAEQPLMSERWIQRNVMGLNDQEILQNKRERLDDVRAAGALEAAGVLGDDADGGADLGGDLGGDAGDDGEAPADAGPGLETAADDNRGQGDLITSTAIDDQIRVREGDTPVKLMPGIKKALYNRRRNLRRHTHGKINVLDRAVSGATAKPSMPEGASSLREAFADVYSVKEYNNDFLAEDQSSILKQEAVLAPTITVKPIISQAELRMMRELAQSKKLDMPDPGQWDNKRRERVLLEHFTTSSSIEHNDVKDFELYDEEDDESDSD